MTLHLPERLKAETRELHTAAERSALMGVLLGGRIERPAYAALLRNLHAIYAVLEPALVAHAGHPLIAPVYLPALWRTASLEQDLSALYGPHWDRLPLQRATIAYVARLQALCSEQPGLLLAHAYVRYLGDLSGGQMLRRAVAASPALAGDHASAFYEFGNPVETTGLSRALRAGLAKVEVTPAQADAVVGEAVNAFALHRQLFDELAGSAGLAR